jgi:hypothetical protein
MALNSSATELTTAATDALLGVLCLVLLWRLHRLPTDALWKRAVWAWVFRLIVGASALGAVAHGLNLPESLRAGLWQPLYLSLGLAVALFLVGAVTDWRGDVASRLMLPWAIGLGLMFWISSAWLGGAFIVFIAYEAATMSAALTIYVFLALTRRVPGAGRVSIGIAISLAAAGIQASHLNLHVVVPFDHNGVFHIVQAIATVAIANGIRRGLAQRTDRWSLDAEPNDPRHSASLNAHFGRATR